MFMLIIWLQGIWLPEHGYSFTETPLWAGIYMLPLTLGLLIVGPLSGLLSDRFGARPFATGGMLGAALSFALLMLLPTDFNYWAFALILFLNGASMGLFASPNRAAVMNSLPAADRGAGGGMNQTFQNSAQVLSIGIFFTLLIVGLASSLPAAMSSGLHAHGVSADVAHRVGQTPPISILFAAFLGYNPIQHLVGAHALQALPAHAHAAADRAGLLPAPDLRPVPGRAAHGVRLRDRRLPRRRRGVVPARRPATTMPTSPPRRRSRAARSRNWRSSMRVEWFGQSAFSLTDGETQGLRRPLRRHVGAGRARNAVRLPGDRGR